MSSYRKLSNFGEKKMETETVIPKLLKIEDKNTLIQNNKVVVVDVYADWCGPCKIVSPLFLGLFPKYNIPGICVLAKENIDAKLSPNIQVVPTFQFFLNGAFDSAITGGDITQVENKIIELVNSISKPHPPTIEKTVPEHHHLADKNPHAVPPQLAPQFQYSEPKPPAPPTSPKSQVPLQTTNEGFQHAHEARQQYYEKPAHLPMQLPIRRK